MLWWCHKEKSGKFKFKVNGQFNELLNKSTSCVSVFGHIQISLTENLNEKKRNNLHLQMNDSIGFQKVLKTEVKPRLFIESIWSAHNEYILRAATTTSASLFAPPLPRREVSLAVAAAATAKWGKRRTRRTRRRWRRRHCRLLPERRTE